MRVKIDHGEKTFGIMFKTTYPTVSVYVTFTEEEIHIIKEQKLGGQMFFERPPPANVADGSPTAWFLYVKHLLKPIPDYVCNNIDEAKTYEEVFVETLRNLKTLFEESAELDETSREIEI